MPAGDPDPNGGGLLGVKIEEPRRFRDELSDPHRAPLPPSSDELIEAVRYATREGQESRADRRRAWARFAAAADTFNPETAAARADELLAEYDKRFTQ